MKYGIIGFYLFFLFLIILLAIPIMGCGGREKLVDDDLKVEPEISAEDREITQLQIERFSDSCTSDEVCGSYCRANITITSGFQLSYSVDMNNCQQQATITEDEFLALSSEIQSDNFMSVIQEECDTSGVGFFAITSYSLTLDNETKYSSSFYCESPSNLDAVNALVLNYLSDYLPTVYEGWYNL
jgi:hypothetical protein